MKQFLMKYQKNKEKIMVGFLKTTFIVLGVFLGMFISFIFYIFYKKYNDNYQIVIGPIRQNLTKGPSSEASSEEPSSSASVASSVAPTRRVSSSVKSPVESTKPSVRTHSNGNHWGKALRKLGLSSEESSEKSKISTNPNPNPLGEGPEQITGSKKTGEAQTTNPNPNNEFIADIN